MTTYIYVVEKIWYTWTKSCIISRSIISSTVLYKNVVVHHVITTITEFLLIENTKSDFICLHYMSPLSVSNSVRS